MEAPWWSLHHIFRPPDLNTHHIPSVVLDPFHPTQTTLMNNKRPVKLQWLCAGIYARLQLTETPSAPQIIGPNHCSISGFSTCHMRLYICKPPAIIPAEHIYFGIPQQLMCLCRPANAVTVQLRVRWAAKPHRHPYSATGSITHCLQWRCSGSCVSKPFCAGDLVPGYSRAWERYVVFLKGFASRASIFPMSLPFGLQFICITRQTKPEPWVCKSFVFVTLGQHRCGL